MPKPNKGKTETIKDRAIHVYLPSQQMAEEWKTRASKASTSISKFVIERIEDSIRRARDLSSEAISSPYRVLPQAIKTRGRTGYIRG